MTQPLSPSRLCLLVLLFGVVALTVLSLWLPVPTSASRPNANEREAATNSGVAAPEPASGSSCRDPNSPERPNIQAGREVTILEWIEPLRRDGVGGLGIDSVEVARDHLQIRLHGQRTDDCSLPSWAGSAGVLAIGCGGLDIEGTPPPEGRARHGDFVSAWWRCDRSRPFDGQATLELLAARYDDDIWGVTLDATLAASDAQPGPVPEGWTVPEPASPARLGLLGPAAAWLGTAPSTVMLWTFMLGGLASLVAFIAWTRALGRAAGTPSADSEDASGAGHSRRRWRVWSGIVLLGIVLAAIALRWWLGASLDADGDEVWGRASQFPVFSDDHDAWVHPPLYRLLQYRWSAFVLEHGASSPSWLRVPAALASMIAAVGLAVLAWVHGARPLALIVVGVCVSSPVLAQAGVLARPYGLASMLFVALLLALHGPRDRPLWPMVTLAAGLVAWCDLLYGVAAVLVVALELSRAQLQREHRAWSTAAWAMFVMSIWIAPLIPGAVEASQTQVSPIPGGDGPSQAPPDLRPEDTASARARALLSLGGWGLGTPMGALTSCGLIAMCVARRRVAPAMLVGAVYVAAGVAAAVVELRPRNALFIPLATAAAWLIVLGRQSQASSSCSRCSHTASNPADSSSSDTPSHSAC